MVNDKAQGAPWMRFTLRAAGVYNVLWGALTVLYPAWWFQMSRMELPRYPEIWQAVGMIVGVYGIGYWVAARAPLVHWPIVLVGFLGKVFGPIGFAQALGTGAFPLAAGWTILTNDLIWWVPFGLILWASLRYHVGEKQPRATALPVGQALTAAKTQTGESLATLTDRQPTLLVFLRHFGCTFCMEMLADLRKMRPEIEARGHQIVLVHTSTEAQAAAALPAYAMADVPRVSDPEAQLYESFSLPLGRFGQLFGPIVWLRGVRALFRGHGVGALQGNGLQMPGTFLVHRGKILAGRPARHAADHGPLKAAVHCELPIGDTASAQPVSVAATRA